MFKMRIITSLPNGIRIKQANICEILKKNLAHGSDLPKVTLLKNVCWIWTQVLESRPCNTALTQIVYNTFFLPNSASSARQTASSEISEVMLLGLYQYKEIRKHFKIKWKTVQYFKIIFHKNGNNKIKNLTFFSLPLIFHHYGQYCYQIPNSLQELFQTMEHTYE